MVEFNWWEPALVMMFAMMFGYYIHAFLDRARDLAAKHTMQQMLENARKESDLLRKESKVHAKDELNRVKDEFERETKERRSSLADLEERVSQREINLDRRVSVLDKKEESIDEKLSLIDMEKGALNAGRREFDDLIEEQRNKLQEIGILSQDEAREMLMKELDEELQAEQGAMIRRAQDNAKAQAEDEARKIVTMAIERYAGSQVNEITTAAVDLPNNDMKGRIIGREGRNIRSLEATTGVNILIDDTPEVVIVSGFDPLRREVARTSLQRLISDGRIHPARIEEVVAEVESEVEDTIHKAGEEALIELGLQGVDPEVVRTIGKLKFRHSYGQNILKHSIEMGHLMGTMASELKLEADVAKRAGLLHDIGKAMDHQVEGGHAIIGADFLKRHGESQVICNAVAAHHNDVDAESLYAHLVKAADAMTASRPGARSETTEIYLKRLEKLEEIASSFRGVEKCYAIQAGREIRVIVEPSQINDNEAMQMARNISKQIEQELTYPGQIKITVMRETRCVEYAK